MSKEQVIDALDQSLKLLNPDYTPEETEATHHLILTSFGPYSDEAVIEVLRTPWAEEKIKGGIATKLMPYTLSEGVYAWIELHFDTLEMEMRDALLEWPGGIKEDGTRYENPKIRAIMDRVAQKERNQND